MNTYHVVDLILKALALVVSFWHYKSNAGKDK